MGPRVYRELSIIVSKEPIAKASLGGDYNRWYHVEVELVTIADMSHRRLEAWPHAVYILGQNGVEREGVRRSN